MLCGSVDARRAGEYMAEVRTSSQCERPCAAIEETRKALGDAGGSKDPGQRKVHSLIDKVYDFKDLPAAKARMESDAHAGKIVVKIS